MEDVRRVVSGQSKTGTAVISSDGPVPTVIGSPGGPILYEIWKTFATPAVLSDQPEEPAAGPFVLEPPVNGSVFRISIIPPDSEMDHAEHHPVFDQMATHSPEDSKAAMLHRTNSIDYGIVLEGSITLVVDDGETELHAGDVVIQRGANHAWSNRTDAPCKMAFIMINAQYP